ncbi:MAG: HPr kinase/phosphorylase [Malacoplasma sp.]|nr:HPr kinase/phosphorylase [Malacoplasma sp.]
MNWKNFEKSFPNYEYVNIGAEKEIISNRITRTGLEFANFFVHNNLKAVVLWGNDEYLYLKQFNESEITLKLEKILSLKPPLIVLSRSFPPFLQLVELTKKYNITLVATKQSSADLTNAINTFLTENLSKQEFIHGNLVEVYGLGVLIIGDSGLGKSEITIELTKHGHLFVSDDAIICKNVYHKIIGSPPAATAGFIEVRGLGIINAAKMFGIEKVKESTQINVIIELVVFNPAIHNFDRLGKDLQYKEILGVKIPYFLLPVSQGKKISDLIEVTVAQLKLIQTGYNSFEELIKKPKK